MKITRLVCPFLCIFLCCSCASPSTLKSSNPKQEIGENTQEVIYDDKYIASIQYPKMKINKLDQKILTFIENKKNAFQKQLHGFDENRKAEVNITYESYLKDNRYISLCFTVYEVIYNVHETIDTFVYDQKENRFLDLYDVYEQDKIQKLSELANNYFKERFPLECDNDQFRTHISAVEENFNTFILRKDRMIFYFEKGTLFENSATFEIGYQKLKNAITLKNETVKTLVPYQDILNEPVKNIKKDQPMIALTFDDGPTRRYTTAILDALKENNASATFFVLGSRANNAPDLLQRMVLEGNEIGNHTFSHKQLTTLSKENMEEEIIATQESIYGITHRYPDIIRPPYGSKNDTVVQCAQGRRIVTWTLDTKDWSTRNAKTIVDQVMSTIKDGDIVLMHDLYASSAQAATILIPKLKEAGYQLVTVSDLYLYRPDTK